MKRKSRNKFRKKLTDDQMLAPLDVTKFGGPDDPCFGKYHDLKATECRNCGDSELCAIAMSYKGIAMRQKLEMETSFKDIEDVGIDLKEKRIKRYIKKKLAKGLEIRKIYKKAARRYNIPILRIEEIYKEK